MLRPDVGAELLEIAGSVDLVPFVSPEVDGHGREGLADDHLASLAGVRNGFARFRIHDVDVVAEREHLHFADVHGSAGVRGDEGGCDLGAACGVADLNLFREGSVEPTVLLGGKGRAGAVHHSQVRQVVGVLGFGLRHLQLQQVAGGGSEVGDPTYVSWAT